MGKYILKYVDDVEDDLSATVTYEFKTDSADSVIAHVSHFMRAVGFSWIESIEIIKQKFGEDGDGLAFSAGFDEFSNELEESSNDGHIIFGGDVNSNNVSVSRDSDTL